MSRGERAKELFLEGYACSQSVVIAFEDVLSMDREELAKISLAFGGGFSRQRLTCGAISGAGMVLGILYATGTPDLTNRKEVYGRVQELCRRFKDKRGTLLCKDLLTTAGVEVSTSPTPNERTESYYSKRPCPEIVKEVGDLLEEYLKENGKL